MKTPLLLHAYNHIVFPSVVMAGNDTGDTAHTDIHNPLLIAEIGFKQGIFRLQGDWQYIMSCNKHVQPAWLAQHNHTVTIEGNILPSGTIDLADSSNDGAVFIVEGRIKDKAGSASCSGLLVLDKKNGYNKQGAESWHISFYIYDDNGCEVALKIPVLLYTTGSQLN